jgi:hypothetical protein
MVVRISLDDTILLDHIGAFIPFRADDVAETLDDIFRGDDIKGESNLSALGPLGDRPIEHETKWTQEGKGLLAHKFVNVLTS